MYSPADWETYNITDEKITRTDEQSARLNIKGSKTMNEKIQTIKMCIKTYENLNGHKPTITELARMLDASYLQLIPMMLSKQAA